MSSLHKLEPFLSYFLPIESGPRLRDIVNEGGEVEGKTKTTLGEVFPPKDGDLKEVISKEEEDRRQGGDSIQTILASVSA